MYLAGLSVKVLIKKGGGSLKRLVGRVAVMQINSGICISEPGKVGLVQSGAWCEKIRMGCN